MRESFQDLLLCDLTANHDSVNYCGEVVGTSHVYLSSLNGTLVWDGEMDM